MRKSDMALLRRLARRSHSGSPRVTIEYFPGEFGTTDCAPVINRDDAEFYRLARELVLKETV
jgi:hypothetical protein